MSGSGDFLAALDTLESMLSECATFQTEAGAVDASAAKGFIFWPGQKPYTEVATKGRKRKQVWPNVWALLMLGQGAGLDLSAGPGGGCIFPVVPLQFFLQRSTPAAEAEDPKLETRNFLKWVGLVLRELAILGNSEGNLFISQLTIDNPRKNDEAELYHYMEITVSVERMNGGGA